tara:strand:- start:313 stop:537 length:225 start_codon:yes stop_codon:yes gene_type:complete
MSLILVSLGVLLCFFGLLGLGIVIYFGFQIRKQAKINSEEKRKTTFEKLIVLNYLALCLSAFGLVVLVLGLFLS